MTGTLWRNVVNYLGEEEITPHIYLSLIRMIAEHHAADGYFLQWLPKTLTDSEARTRLDRDLHYARIGHEIITNYRELLFSWASMTEGGPYKESLVESWWNDTLKGVKHDSLEARARESLYTHAMDNGEQLLALLPLKSEDKLLLYADRDRFQNRAYYLIITWLQQHHKWALDLKTLRNLAVKTWPANTSSQKRWTSYEFDIAEEYYSEQQPMLVYEDADEIGIDPFSVWLVNQEQSLGVGMGELHLCMYIILRSAYIDFMDEILEHSSFPRVRGSLRCVECGKFVGRHARGYGQLYCGSVCKKRAAKRRYRSKAQGQLIASALALIPQGTPTNNWR